MDIQVDHLERAGGILDQLLKYTHQLAAFENDPGVDIFAISEACGQRMDELARVLPQAMSARGTARSEITEKVKKLYDQVLLCTPLIERARAQTAARMEKLSRTRRAVRAYHS